MTRVLTRSFGLIPSLVVAIAVGRPGITVLLVASQVVLSIVLPFVTLPLILLTSSKRVMSVRAPEPDDPTRRSEGSMASEELSTSEAGGRSRSGSESSEEKVTKAEEKETTAEASVVATAVLEMPYDPEGSKERVVDFSNGKFTIAIGVVIWLIIVAANLYTIVSLAMGKAQ